jgi:hypothetical protein
MLHQRLHSAQIQILCPLQVVLHPNLVLDLAAASKLGGK